MSTKDWIEKDFYKTLGVPKNASQDDVKKAYRKIARENHPDAHPGDTTAEDRFKSASEAYSVLSDAGKRKEYDEARSLFGAGAFRRGGGGGGAPGGFGGGAPGGFDMGDLFNGAGGSGGFGDLFGSMFGPRNAGPARGGDIETDATLEFEEAARGVTVPLRLHAPGACDTCHGSGARPGTSPRTCPVCHGAGTVSRDQGAFSFSEPCRECQGAGTVIDDPCPECHGTGSTTKTRTLKVRIPAGVADGQRIRLKGRGQPGRRGGPAGDLFVVVHVRGHRMFGRRGHDLTVSVPITFPEAVFGTTIRVPTLDGTVGLKVPAGSNSGKVLRVRGRGIGKESGGNGDLLVTLNIQVPSEVNAEAAEALSTFAEAMPTSPRPWETERHG